jgi:hypothetical protein
LRELWRASIGEDKDNKFSFFNTTKFPESQLGHRVSAAECWGYVGLPLCFGCFCSEALREVMKKAGLPSTPAPDAMPHDKKFKVWMGFPAHEAFGVLFAVGQFLTQRRCFLFPPET